MDSSRPRATGSPLPYIPRSILRSAIGGALTAVGKHKHMVIINLQALIHRRTECTVPVEVLWKMLGELYDLEALDEMVSRRGRIHHHHPSWLLQMLNLAYAGSLRQGGLCSYHRPSRSPLAGKTRTYHIVNEKWSRFPSCVDWICCTRGITPRVCESQDQTIRRCGMLPSERADPRPPHPPCLSPPHPINSPRSPRQLPPAKPRKQQQPPDQVQSSPTCLLRLPRLRLHTPPTRPRDRWAGRPRPATRRLARPNLRR